ncbi:MAG: class I SAM-dependent methyltransferase [Fimbriimonas sp.]|nr:class I SAM-dependent methyltransferase [Fimbriimonas sp.]
MTRSCRVCSDDGPHPAFVAHERMFGTGEAFEYFQCAVCGCLQIADIPEDLSRFYPPHYYSFHLGPVRSGGIKGKLVGARDRFAASGSGLIGRLLCGKMPAQADVRALGRIPLRPSMRILDVGCGRGKLLSILHRAGFRKLAGVDPYLAEDTTIVDGIRVQATNLESISGEFDLIMLHHAFEHVGSGYELLHAASMRLAKGGKILLRIPSCDSDAFESYGAYWVGLDAPRHLFLYSRKSLEILAEKVGLTLESCWCDGDSFDYWGSEMYIRGLSLFHQDGSPRPPESVFDLTEMETFARLAAHSNLSDRGGQIAVILSK